jgi:hypothetical protein
MSAEDYREYCSQEHAIRLYRSQRRDASSGALENKTATRRVLLELLKSKGEDTVAVRMCGEVWSARVQRRQRVQRLDWSTVEVKLEELWSNSEALEDLREALREALRQEALRQEALDQEVHPSGRLEAIVDTLLERGAPELLSREGTVCESLQVRKEPRESSLEVLEGESSEEVRRLLGTFVESRRTLQRAADEVKGAMSLANERRREAADRIVDALEKSEESGPRKLDRISVEMSDSTVADYYLRLKAENASGRRSVTFPALRKVFHQVLGSELKSLSADAASADYVVDYVCDGDLRARLMSALRSRFANTKQRTGLRLCMDRVRQSQARE